MENVSDVVRKLWGLCGALRDDGISYHEYLGELSSLLFLKLANEMGLEGALDDRLSWRRLSRSQDDEGLLERYEQALNVAASSNDIRLRSIFEGVETRVRSAHALRRLIDGISDISWYRGTGAMGDIYEGLIEKNATESRYGAGQYFTPRALVDAMVRVTAPGPTDVVYDPAAGTAGFLVAAAAASSNSGLGQPALQGQELVRSVQRMALMNVFLHGYSADIRYGDTLSVDSRNMGATVCLSNPPFGVRGALAPAQRALLPFPTSNKQLAFLQHIYLSLVPGGRAAVVLPDNALFESGVAANVRRQLLDEYNVHTVLRLPAGIFYATGVRTSVVFFAKTRSTREVWTYDLRAANSSFSRRRQLQHSDLKDFERAFGKDPLGEDSRSPSQHFYVTQREDLSDLGDTLDIPVPNGGAIKEQASTEAMIDLLIDELQTALTAARDIARLIGVASPRDLP